LWIGDALGLGIGAMTDAAWQFLDKMVRNRVVKATRYEILHAALVNRKVGVELAH